MRRQLERAVDEFRRADLQSRQIDVSRVTLLFAALATGFAVACGASPPPDILIVTLDTTRADRLGSYGYPEGTTPVIDALAREATVFEHCVAPMGTTTPSHATILTGLNPKAHGVYSNRDPLPNDIPTLAERFRDAGYATGAFVSLWTLVESGGLDRGFEDVGRFEAKRAQTGHRLAALVRDGSETVAAAVEWLTSIADADRRPFFGWLHLYEPHSPYPLTPYAREKLRDHESRFADGISVYEFGFGGWMGSPDDRAAVQALYDGRVHHADELVGNLIQAIERLGLKDRLILVVTADHGQALGDHGLPGHGRGLWQSVLEVPLLVWQARSREERRVSERVGLVDLFPTLLELAGLARIPEGDGRSLAGALRDEPLAQVTYFSSVNAKYLQHRGQGSDPPVPHVAYEVAVFDGDLKLMRGPAGVAVFDLDVDPGESAPLRPQTHGDAYERLSGLAGAYLGDPAPEQQPARIEEEVIEGLRALGYTD